MEIKKEKIKSISHSEKMWWIKINPTTKAVKFIHDIIREHSPDGWGLELSAKLTNPTYKNWKNYETKFYNDLECGYLIFRKTHINLLLRKDCKLFNKLKKSILEHFEFVKTKKK